MDKLLFGYGIRLFDALMILLLIVVAGALGYRAMRQRWRVREKRWVTELKETQRRIEALEQELKETQKRYDPAYWRTLHDHLQEAVAHDCKQLNWIAVKSIEVMSRLRPDQVDLHEKQKSIAALAYELLRHAENVVGLFVLEPDLPERELVNLPGLIDKVLAELFPFAETQGVTLRRELAALEPTQGNRYLMSQIFANLIHNAIKYSMPGGVVNVKLYLQDETIRVDVHDRGRGVEEGDKTRVFELRTRGDGLIQPGSGLGLYYARELARLHGGDLTLVQSQVNQGSTFRVLLPYRSEIW
jgi:signal transduction histidine kinase